MSSIANIVSSDSGVTATMCSTELVEIINKLREEGDAELRHDNFMSKIEKVLGGDALKFQGIYQDSINRSKPCYYLPKREASLMVMSESYAVQAKVYDRMIELEAQTTTAIPTSFAAALRLAAEQAETIEAQSRKLEAAKPALEFVNRYADATGSKGFRQVCKLLGANESEFRLFLQSEKIMYLLGGEWVPHSCHQDAGRFEVKAGVAATSQHAFNQARFTPKGVTWVAGEWAKYQLTNQVAA
jgi:phage antirepressor YoqD-like protein